eukprot:8661430-Prorocentrum_lima.AAC.1
MTRALRTYRHTFILPSDSMDLSTRILAPSFSRVVSISITSSSRSRSEPRSLEADRRRRADNDQMPGW